MLSALSVVDPVLLEKKKEYELEDVLQLVYLYAHLEANPTFGMASLYNSISCQHLRHNMKNAV